MTVNTYLALEKARLARAAKVAAGELPAYKYKSPIERAAAKPKSAKLAIAAKCYQCEGEDSDPGWRKRIGGCSVKSCPLWNLRPYQASDDDDGGE
jgi:hypothetical protein